MDDKVAFVGGMGITGVMMKAEVFDSLKAPYFRMAWKGDFYTGEDIEFCVKCLEAGIDIWCDTDLVFAHMDTRPVSLVKGG